MSVQMRPVFAARSMSVNLGQVLILDDGENFAQHLDELHRGRRGQARQYDGHDDGARFHCTSSIAAWSNSMFNTCRAVGIEMLHVNIAA